MAQQFKNVEDLENAIMEMEQENIELENVVNSTNTVSSQNNTVNKNDSKSEDATLVERSSILKMVEDANKNNPELERFKKVSNILNTVDEDDIGKISIKQSVAFEQIHSLLNEIVARPTYDVIAFQSGYKCAMSALTNNDIVTINNSGGYFYDIMLKFLTIIYKHIKNNSLGKLSYQEWLNKTSEYDLPTLVYGIYCATYPNESDYTVVCPHCEAQNKTKISKEYLKQTKSHDIVDYIETVLDKYIDNPKELAERSILSTKDYILLDESKVLFSIKVPSLNDYLISMRNIKNKDSQFKNIDISILGLMRNIDSVAIPNLSALSKGNKEYILLENSDMVLSLMQKLSAKDAEKLIAAIDKKEDSYAIDYKLPDITCSSCGNEINDIKVNMFNQVFSPTR